MFHLKLALERVHRHCEHKTFMKMYASFSGFLCFCYSVFLSCLFRDIRIGQTAAL